eukprot:1161878-Pelagomonas_calceolata.AAC.2
MTSKQDFREPQATPKKSKAPASLASNGVCAAAEHLQALPGAPSQFQAREQVDTAHEQATSNSPGRACLFVCEEPTSTGPATLRP